MDDEENITLAELFGFPPRSDSPLLCRHSSSTEHRRRSSSPVQECLCSTAYNSVEKSLRKGDIVWGKAFPYTWWPGQVESFRGLHPSVSFFGCRMTRSFESSEIRGFEEGYPRMVSMVGLKLSYEIRLALEELARSSEMGLRCSCRGSSAEDKRDFHPFEIFRFVLDKAVSPWVGYGEVAAVVRISAELNAFRHDLLVCKTSEVDEGFLVGEILEFVLDVAVNPCVRRKEIDCFDGKVTQLNAFRRFASVKPDWFYQLDGELEEVSSSSYMIEGCPSEDEMHHALTRPPEVDVSVESQEESEVLEVSHMQGGSNICEINMADFSMFDMDEKYECISLDQPQADSDECQSAVRDINRNTGSGKMLHSCAQGSSGKLEVDSEVQCCRKLSLNNDANETVASMICVSENKEVVTLLPLNCPNHMPQVGNEVPLTRSKVGNLENTMQEASTSFLVCNQNYSSVEVVLSSCDSADIILSSAENPLQKALPLSGGQMHSFPYNKYNTFSPIKASNPATKPQPIEEVCFNTSNAALCVDVNPQMASLAETARQIVTKKRKLQEPITGVNGKLHLVPASCSETLPLSSPLMNENHSNHVNYVNDKAHCKANVGNNAIRLHFSNQHSHPSEAFHTPPLLKDGLPANNTLKSSISNNCTFYSTSLNMKFPMHFTLPSKEDLVKKFSIFGPLDHTRTKVFFYTGAGQVVFLHQSDAVAAYNYVTRKKIFGQANVRFWFNRYEKYRKSSPNISGTILSSKILKPCLRKSGTHNLSDKRKSLRVRFSCDNELGSLTKSS